MHGAYGRDRFEVIVKAGDTHPQLPGQLLHAQGLIEILADALHGASDGRGRTAHDGQMAQPAALLPPQKAIDDLAHDHRHQDRHFGRRIDQPDQSHDGVQQVRV